MTTAQEAADIANEARREIAGLDGRMGAMEATVQTHRQESQLAHRETQRMVGELSTAVAHIRGVASVTAPVPPPETGPSITLTPAKVVSAAKWIGGLLAALGLGGGVLSQCVDHDAATAAIVVPAR